MRPRRRPTLAPLLLACALAAAVLLGQLPTLAGGTSPSSSPAAPSPSSSATPSALASPPPQPQPPHHQPAFSSSKAGPRRRWGSSSSSAATGSGAKGKPKGGKRPSWTTTSSASPWLAGGVSRTINSVGGGFLIPLFLMLKNAKASPFDPHPLPLLLGLCFFNGWYIRVTDHERNLAFALIVGSFKHPGANTYTEHYVALLYADKTGNLLTAHAFPDPDSVTIDMDSEGYVGVPSNFTWRSQEIGELHIDHHKGHFDFALPGFAAEATFHDRVPWSRAKPDVDGPEGWLGKTPLLPCRYFVYSLASRTSYRLRIRNRPSRSNSGAGPGVASNHNLNGPIPAAGVASMPTPPAGAMPTPAAGGGATVLPVDGPAASGGGGGLGGIGAFGRTEVITGRGFAHMESNYGNYFPRGWIWVNAISPHREVKLVMVGGKFEIGPMTPSTWVIGYHSPRFHWNLRTTDLDVVKADVDYSQRSLSLVARSRCGKHRLEVNVTAPPSSFGSPIYVPTPSGFSCLPGCRESFTARARIRAVDETDSPGIVLTEEHEVELAALEFGGDMQRL